MRKLVVAIVCVCIGWGSFAQEAPLLTGDDYGSTSEIPSEEFSEAVPAEDSFAEDDPFADLFEVAEDVSVENQEPATPNSVAATEGEKPPKNVFYKPLTFSGHLEAEVGVSGVFQEGKNEASGFLLFKNEFNVSARISKNLGMSGTISVQYPNFSLNVSSLYFDYLLLDRVYISGGKKTINWGYVQLFNNMSFFDFDFHQLVAQEKEYIPTNILSDSGNMISVHVQVPVWTATISGLVLYPLGQGTAPTFKDLVYAGSAEMTVWETAVNVFGRKNPSSDSALSEDGISKPPVLGMELKRTVLGNDIYGQVVVGIQNLKSMNNIDGYESIISTAGFYRYWDTFIPKIGVSMEYQHVFTPHGERVHSHRTAFLGGLSSIGKRKNMKIALTWNHEYMANDGNLKLGFTVNNVLPHANWKAGLEMQYGREFPSMPKFTLATSIELLMDY